MVCVTWWVMGTGVRRRGKTSATYGCGGVYGGAGGELDSSVERLRASVMGHSVRGGIKNAGS